MKEKFFRYGLLSIVSLCALGAMSMYQSAKINDGKLHVVFCNVGQGDGIYIRTPKGSSIILDGGPDDSILSCLSKHMPFWDRDIELMLLSHPHADHLNGLVDVLERYAVMHFATEDLANDSAGFAQLQKSLQEENLVIEHLVSGGKITTTDGVTITLLSPTKTFLHETSPGGKIGEKGEFASLVLMVSYGEFDAILTGDSQARGYEGAVKNVSRQIEVFQVPHHGSKTGINSSIINHLRPGVAVISVGKNAYGHPSKETLKTLSDNKINILRTDQKGDIEIESDGKSWTVE